ncbi:aminotransferase class III-fold pyridoxal phosphate-dependent enzyme [Aureimonas sp. AU12]|uniref:aminotransferase class III-fold pyridoxal phosphate-dependent enzyme n=1 Tax=Aureimonas sp. AU12 TaxID=1638161 RepID=UPI000782B42B|nr:aminotransferase class III-fold pyridoxal phosphate-dependent enzyme [Aureimonas sp. AU12]
MSHLVSGISSAGRSVPDVDGRRFLVARAKGPYVFDDGGRRFVDTAMGFGATFLGHGHPAVDGAVARALAGGSMPAYAHALEEEAAAALAAHTGALDQVVFLNSGSEAVHLACRAARAATGRRVVAKLAAGYDGWFGEVAFGNAGSDAAAMRGNARPRMGDTVLTRFNDLDDARALIAEEPDLAAIIIEPVMANAGCIAPDPDYLTGLARLAREAGAMVIADEVLMGFRVRRGLVSHAYGLHPDFATLGKAIGNGFAVAALIGTREATAVFRDGRLRQAGTYNGNPIACASVAATMGVLGEIDYGALLETGDGLRMGIEAAFAGQGFDLSTTGFGTVFTPWPGRRVPQTYAEATAAVDPAFTLALHHALRRHGVISMPAPFGRHYLSTAHDREAVDLLLSAFQGAARDLVDRGLTPRH